MTPPPVLVLSYGARRWPLDRRPLTIGRLPECDVVIDDQSVSRHHAYLVPTPDGALLVDRSRHGSILNGATVRAPQLLADGDELRIGTEVLRVAVEDRASRGAPALAPGGRLSRKVRDWVRRYGPSEVFGTVAAVGVAGAVRQATGSTALAAYSAAIAETIVFYGIMFLRDSIREAHQAGAQGLPYGTAQLAPVARDLLLEFGVAEALDLLVVRPLCIGLGLRGTTLGALTGKIGADVVFYGPVLTAYEWRLARTRATRAVDLRRRTTATSLRPPRSPDP